MRIVFMGTPDFAVGALQKLVENNYSIVGVITATDQIAGRGQKLQFSAVKNYALSQGLPILQPSNLKDPIFLEELKELKADIQVVVAFRMLPELVWNMPPLGTFNLHASLLPQYRGAAPINHVLMNGETETGVTTFFLNKEIDTGKIILQKKCFIAADDDAGSLHDKLKHLGAELILETLHSIEKNEFQSIDQSLLTTHLSELKPAPKIFKHDCEINWNEKSKTIQNKIRGLSPYPAAFTFLVNKETGQKYSIKIFEVSQTSENDPILNAGQISTDAKNFLHVKTQDAMLSMEQVQLEGKKRIGIKEFLRGFAINGQWSFTTLI